MGRKLDAYDALVATARATGKIVTLDNLSRIWIASNHDAIVTAAFEMMRSESGTTFSVPPMSFVGFPNDAARVNYYATLMDEFKRTRKGGLNERRLALFHVEKLAEWLRTELTRQLAGIADAAGVMVYAREVPEETEVQP